MKDQLAEALKHSTADYADIRVFKEDATALAYRGPEAETAATWTAAGGIARACTKGGWGCITFETIENLADRVREACRCAAIVGREKTELAAVAPADEEIVARMKNDFRGVSLDDKIALVQDYNRLILKAHPAIQSSFVQYQDSFRTAYFASTQGGYYREDRPRATLAFTAVARDGALVQRGHDSIASTTDYSVVLNQHAKVQEATERALALLKAPQCPAGTFTVVLDPMLAGLFAHEAFGHLSEADFLYENPRMRDLMHLGREMGGKDLNITDDGTLPGLLGTNRFDDEGAPARRVPLITGGALTAHLHSRETAAKMGAAPTGNARAVGKHHPPIVRMRNTFIENGRTPVAQLFAGLDRGIYACHGGGGQTQLEMFTFTAACGYRIEHGQKGELLRDVMLTGNVFATLKNIDAFGNDLRIFERAGGCGKSGQAPLPITFGSPHIRIRKVVVGGT